MAHPHSIRIQNKCLSSDEDGECNISRESSASEEFLYKKQSVVNSNFNGRKAKKYLEFPVKTPTVYQHTLDVWTEVPLMEWNRHVQDELRASRNFPLLANTAISGLISYVIQNLAQKKQMENNRLHLKWWQNKINATEYFNFKKMVVRCLSSFATFWNWLIFSL